jgi:hypothetical protein
LETAVANALQERFAETLLDRIRSDRHPSVTQMDMLEMVAPPRVLAEYALELMRKIEDDPRPSIPMMHRVRRVVEGFGP